MKTSWCYAIPTRQNTTPSARQRPTGNGYSAASPLSIQLARGRAELYPEAPVTVKGFKREIDEAKWTLVTVTHSLNSSGFTTSLDLEVKIDELEME